MTVVVVDVVVSTAFVDEFDFDDMDEKAMDNVSPVMFFELSMSSRFEQQLLISVRFEASISELFVELTIDEAPIEMVGDAENFERRLFAADSLISQFDEV